jgi:replicative DNA helicase
MKRETPAQYGPHDIQAEQELLGCLLLYNKTHQFISSIVHPEHFFEPIHQEIYDICGKLITMGKPATPTTVKTFLPADLMIAEGMSVGKYLAKLAASATTMISAPDFAGIVRDLADYRAIMSVVEMAAAVKGIDSDPGKAATAAIDMLDAIVAERTIGNVPSLTLGASVVRAVDAAAKAYQNDGALTGMPYGLRDLDRKTSGLAKGELTILAGRPGMMKTGLALNFCRSLGKAGHKGIFFSLEMGDESLSRRMISDMLFDRYELPHFRMKAGSINEQDFGRMTEAAKELNDLPLRIEQQTGLSISQIASRARQMKRREGLDFIVVDHIGHVAVEDRYRGNRNNEIGEITKGLLRLARELDVGMVALCQLSRGVESRENKKPSLGDLRDSGELEQDAATVMFVYREAYYLANKEPRAGTAEYEVWQAEMTRCINDLEIIISKQRDGAVGTVRCYVDVTTNAVREQGWTRDAWSNLPDGDRFEF